MEVRAGGGSGGTRRREVGAGGSGVVVRRRREVSGARGWNWGQAAVEVGRYGRWRKAVSRRWELGGGRRRIW
jgi:hypothetical protein